MFRSSDRLAASLWPPALLAQAYPAKPARIVNPFAPGGATDIIARHMAQKLTEAWGQPVVVENRAGASGALGVEHVAKSPPDGYTLLIATQTTHAANPALYAKLPYDAAKDFAPLTLAGSTPLALHGSSVPPGSRRTGADGLCEEKSGKARLRLRRQRHLAAPDHGAAQDHDRHLHGPHPLQGRRAGDDRFPRRPGEPDVRQPADRDRRT